MPPPNRWADLSPEPGILDALDLAGERPESGNQNEKRRWSETFANGCALAVAAGLKATELGKKKILPEELGKTEPLTPLGSLQRKRIDVTVVDDVLGLQVGVSLKGLNFKDGNTKYYDKNLTGRLYEFADEVRLVHEHLPHAFMVGIFFLPLESTRAKERADVGSSFAHTVIKLRDRTGRLDAALAAHASRCDAGYVALYSLGTEPEGFPAGVTRFLDVANPPPQSGRPRIEYTLSLAGVCEDIARKAIVSSVKEWGDPEPDPPADSADPESDGD